MKNYIILFVASFIFTSVAVAQQTEGETTPKKENKFKKSFESESRDRLFLVLNHDNVFHKETNGFATQWYSRGIGAYFMWDFRIKKSEFSIAPGIGYNFAAYYHNAEILEDSTGVSFPVIHDLQNDDDFKRARLAVHYIEIPIEFRYRHTFKNKLSFKLAIGIKGSFKVSATSKEVKQDPNAGYVKHYNIANYKDVNTFRVGPTFRVGYGPVSILGYYNLMPLFDKGRGPEMTPFSIGIAFTTL